jgi:hypothetical protein
MQKLQAAGCQPWYSTYLPVGRRIQRPPDVDKLALIFTESGGLSGSLFMRMIAKSRDIVHFAASSQTRDNFACHLTDRPINLLNT